MPRSNPFLYTQPIDDDTKKLPWLKLAALGTVAIYGSKIIGNLEFVDEIQNYPNLTASFRGEGREHIWPALVGREATNIVPGQYRFKVKDWILENLKTLEESAAKIPRTLDIYNRLFGLAYSGTEKSGAFFQYKIAGEELKPLLPYYEALTGKKFTTEEVEKGFVLGKNKKGIVNLYQHPGSEATYNQLVRGELEVEPLIRNARLVPRHWVRIGEEEIAGATHQGRTAANIQRILGINPISSASSKHPFLIFGETGFLKIPIGSELGSIFGGQEIKVPDLVERGVGLLNKQLTDWTQRYMSLMDNPLEPLNILFKDTKSNVLQKFIQKPLYKLFKNRFGTGGNYTGNFIDLWAKHLRKAGPYYLALGAGYAALSGITRTATGKTPAQLAAYPIAGAHLAYSSLGELTGLNTYTRYQEKVAPGSTSPLALVGAGLAGGIATQTADYLYQTYKNQGVQGWRTIRRTTNVELPEALSFIKKVPFISDFFKDVTRPKMMFRLGVLGGLVTMLPMIPGMLGSEKSPEELRAEYSGERPVNKRRGRFWEAGRGYFFGEEIVSQGPSWFAKLQNEYREKDLYGEDYDRPFKRMIMSIVSPYYYESQNYYRKPYPITGSYTSSFGPLGVLYDMTIGRIIKPIAKMHESEWEPEGKQIALEKPFERSAYDLGGLGPEEAISPFSFKHEIARMGNTFIQAAGLPGFMFESWKEKMTGSPYFGVDQPVLASASEEYGAGAGFQALDLAGGASLSESWRRFFTKEPFALQRSNPLQNDLPSFIPTSGAVNLHYGNPADHVKESEYRLPGPGFETRFPELKGKNPEEYPDYYKYMILSDIAPESKEYNFYKQRVHAQYDNTPMVDEIQRIDQMRVDKEIGNFAPTEDIGILGHYYRGLVDTARLNPLEFLLPISPVHKLMGPTTVEQNYLENKVLAPEYSRWGTPIQGFIKPAINVLLHDIGLGGIPSEVKERNKIQERFDALEYIKAQKLAEGYGSVGQYWESKQWEKRASNTFAGVDIYGMPEDVEKVFPKRERMYFRAFKESALEDQLKMLEYVPEYQRPIYEAALENTNQTDYNDKQGVLLKYSEGDQEFGEYLSQLQSGGRQKSYARFAADARATKILMDSGIPDNQWEGWSPHISLQDVKMKVVQQESKNIHDFNLWESRALALKRKPYITDEVAQKALVGGNYDYHKSNLIHMLSQANLPPQNLVVGNPRTRGQINIDVQYDNRKDLHQAMVKHGMLNI